MLLSIIIPTYNEAKTVTNVLDQIFTVDIPQNIQKEIIIVDDGSTDNTDKICKEYADKADSIITFKKFEQNKGKGAAIRAGLSLAKGDFVIFQDADLEYNPRDYPNLIRPIIENKADVVFGSRFMTSSQRKNPLFYLGNMFLTKLTVWITGLKITDMETCYKLCRRDILNSLELKEDRFGIEPEITCKIAKIKNIRIVEIPITYSARSYRDGKKIKYQDGLRALFCILKYGL